MLKIAPMVGCVWRGFWTHSLGGAGIFDSLPEKFLYRMEKEEALGTASGYRVYVCGVGAGKL
ncbi:MAG TPA: hypothetical protein VG324_13850 [Blastocatellia bacterium]|nr:hypothetical protein [Blastocatellia bacterium]